MLYIKALLHVHQVWYRICFVEAMRIGLIKVVVREFVLFTLPVSIFVALVYVQTGEGGLALVTKIINWIALLLYQWFSKKHEFYFYWNVGVSLRSLIISAILTDLIVTALILLLHG
jgi:hypothetical protein